MTVTVFAHITINDDAPEALAEYFQITAPLLESVGAKIVNRITLSESVVGKPVAKTIVEVEYPDRDAVLKVFRSAEYERAIPARDRAFTEYHISICGSDDLEESTVETDLEPQSGET